MSILQSIKKHRIVVIGLFLFLLFFLSAFFFFGSQIQETLALATSVRPEKFTELYFEQHTQLPRDAEAHKVHSFTFTIHNLEYETMHYPYSVYVEMPDKTRITITDGTVTLRHNASSSLPVVYSLPITVTRAKMVVELRNLHQTIHYWIGKEV